MSIFHEILPVDGLRSRDMAFDPATLMLMVGQTPEALRVLNPGQQIKDALVASPSPTARRAEIFHRLDENAARFQILIQHELDHLRRHLSTSYGLVYHHVQSRQASLLRNLFQHTSLKRKNDLLPIFTRFEIDELYRRFPANLSEFAAYFDGADAPLKNTVLALGGNSFCRALDDDLALKHLQPCFASLLALNTQARERKWLSDDAGTVLFDETLPPDLLATGNACVAVKGHFLSARALLEFMADFQQHNWLAALGGKGKSLLEDYFGLSSEYTLVPQLWSGLFGEYRDSPLPIRDETELFIEAYTIYPLELYAAVDLALWIPLSPQGLHSPEDFLTWPQLQPGLRFLHILDYFRKQAPPFTSILVADRNDRFLAIQQEVCDALGWTSPREVLDAWLRFFEGRESQDDYFLEGANSVRLRATHSLLQQRAQTPCDLFLNNVDFHTLGIPRFSAWYFTPASESASLIQQWDGNEQNYALIMFALVKVARLLLTGHAKTQVLGMPDHLRQAALEILASTLEFETPWLTEKFIWAGAEFLGQN
jgi:hypothetical protein